MDALIETLTIFLRYCTIGLFGLYMFILAKVSILIADNIVAAIKRKKNKNKSDGDTK